MIRAVSKTNIVGSRHVKHEKDRNVNSMRISVISVRINIPQGTGILILHYDEAIGNHNIVNGQ